MTLTSPALNPKVTEMLNKSNKDKLDRENNFNNKILNNHEILIEQNKNIIDLLQSILNK